MGWGGGGGGCKWCTEVGLMVPQCACFGNAWIISTPLMQNSLNHITWNYMASSKLMYRTEQTGKLGSFLYQSNNVIINNGWRVPRIPIKLACRCGVIPLVQVLVLEPHRTILMTIRVASWFY